MRSETVIGRRDNAPLRVRRRPPFFRERWNETYGWSVAVILAAVLGCAIAFGALADAVTDGDVLTIWDARLNRWFNENASPPLTRAVELFTHAGSGLWLVALAAVAVAILGWRRAWA